MNFTSNNSILFAALLAISSSLAGADSSGIQHAIINIDDFLDKCPTNDPALSTIMEDFTIRRNGRIVDSFYCVEPVSSMSSHEVSQELKILQTLRTIYYVDRGRSNHLPWTSGTMYEWLKSKVAGIGLVDYPTNSHCCVSYDDGEYFVMQYVRPYVYDRAASHFRHRYLGWHSISGYIGLFIHEARHVDGYSHPSCCEVGTAACDQTFDENNLSPYGTQWWLQWAYLTGHINVGLACIQSKDDFYLYANSANSYRPRFCDNKPPVLELPENPGGICYGPSDSEPSIIVRLEEPVNNSYATGIGNIRGWAVSTSGIDHVELYINDQYRFDIPFGGARGDIQKKYPGYHDSLYSGFGMTYNFSLLSEMTPSFTVRAYNNRGEYEEATANIGGMGFHQSYISGSNPLDLSVGQVYGEQNKIILDGIAIDGYIYNLELQWSKEKQGFEIIMIEDSGGGVN